MINEDRFRILALLMAGLNSNTVNLDRLEMQMVVLEGLVSQDEVAVSAVEPEPSVTEAEQ